MCVSVSGVMTRRTCDDIARRQSFGLLKGGLNQGATDQAANGAIEVGQGTNSTKSNRNSMFLAVCFVALHDEGVVAPGDTESKGTVRFYGPDAPVG